MLTSLNLSEVFDTEDHHVLLICLRDWQKWVSHPEQDRLIPISHISRPFWWVVSFQPWKLLFVWLVLPLVSFNTKLWEVLRQQTPSVAKEVMRFLILFHSCKHRWTCGGKKDAFFKNALDEWKKGVVQCEKDRRRWGTKTAERFDEVHVCLTCGCARKEHYHEHRYTLSTRLMRWPKQSHSGPPASSVSITSQTAPSAIHTQTLTPSLFSSCTLMLLSTCSF